MRQVWIAVMTMAGEPCKRMPSIAANVERMLERMEAAAIYAPDIVCIPEDFKTWNLEGDELTYRQELTACPNEELFAQFSQWAKDHQCYVICPSKIIEGNVLRNTAVIFDRDGIECGRSQKIHPTEWEIEQTVMPGDACPPVFALDFGTIGIQICFDINWNEPWNLLREQQAEVVFWPSAYAGGLPLSHLACRYGYQIAAAPLSNDAKIFDINGALLGTSGLLRPWLCMPLNLDKQLYHLDHQANQIPSIERKYGRSIRIHFSHQENWFVLESVDEQLTVNEIEQEYQLVNKWEYLQRAKRVVDGKRHVPSHEFITKEIPR